MGGTYSRDGNAVGNLLQDWTGGAKGWGGDVLSGVVVDDDGSDGIEDDLESLQHVQSLGEVSGLTHLSEKTEEGYMGAVGEDNVGDSSECLVQVGVHGSLESCISSILDTNTDHSDDDSSKDTDEG